MKKDKRVWNKVKKKNSEFIFVVHTKKTRKRNTNWNSSERKNTFSFL
jgi:hypothetical protein